MKSAIPGLILLFLSFWPSAGMAQSFDSHARNPFRREVLIPEFTEMSLVSIPLDSQIFKHAAVGFSDLRVIDSSGIPVSHLLRRISAEKTRLNRVYWPAKQIEIDPLPDGRVRVRFRLEPRDPSQGIIPNVVGGKPNETPIGIRILTPFRDFENQIQVFGIDGMGKQKLLTESLLLDYRNGGGFRHDTIFFSPENYKQFQIIQSRPSPETEPRLLDLARLLGIRDPRKGIPDRNPNPIERIDFFTDVPTVMIPTPVTDHVTPLSWKVTEDSKTHSTQLDIETEMEPVTSLTIKTGSRNFQRSAILEYEEKKGRDHNWTVHERGTLKRLEYPGIREEQLILEFPETRRQKMRLLIENGDNTPISLEGLDLGVSRMDLVFLASQGENYYLEYGDPEATEPLFDVASIYQILKRNIIPLSAKFGKEELINPKHRGGFSWKFLWHPSFLAGVMILLALLLGRALFMAAKRIDLSQRDPNS